MKQALILAGVVALVTSVPLSMENKGIDGTPRWVNRNDVDWKACNMDQVSAQSALLTVAIEEKLHQGKFEDHHAFLYRCDVGENPFYLRYTLQTGGTTLLNLQWPSILDETYLFASAPEDKDKIGYGFRIMVSSETKQRAHFRRFFFHTLKDMNRFISAVSKMTNDAPTILHKADFFKAPRFDIDAIADATTSHNEFGDHYFGVRDADLLKAADQGQPTVPEDQAGETAEYVKDLIGQAPSGSSN